jgi:hypothetical protein
MEFFVLPQTYALRLRARFHLVAQFCCAVLVATFALTLSPNAVAQFAAGCGPFFGGSPNIANFPNGNQLPVNTVIPIDTLSFGLATQQIGCTPYMMIRGVPGQLGTLPPGVTASLATVGSGIQVIRFNGTPTALGTYGPYGIEVSPDNGGATWAPAMTVTFVVSSCLDWNGSRNERFPLSYPTTDDFLSIPQPTAGVAFAFDGALQNTLYTQDAYCAVSSWTLNNFGGGTMAVVNSNPAPRAFNISGVPATTPPPQVDGCLTPDTGADASITGVNGLGEQIATVNFCFAESNGGTLVIGGNPPSGTVGNGYSTALTTNGPPGAVFTLLSGALPPGLTLASDGTISGTPTQAGTFNFTAQVAATLGGDPQTASGSFSITIAAAPIAETNVSVPTLGAFALALLATLIASAAALGTRSRRNK